MQRIRTVRCVSAMLIALACSVLMATSTNNSGVRCEIWHNLDGGQITDTLANGDLSTPAGETRFLESFELNPAPEEPQACALRGFILPPATGDYIFEISGDDTALLFLSNDHSYSAARIIATVPSYTGVHDFKHFTAQTSRPIHLVAGKRYFTEAMLKNQEGASHISVGWTLPDGTEEAPIPGTRLIPRLRRRPRSDRACQSTETDARARFNARSDSGLSQTSARSPRRGAR